MCEITRYFQTKNAIDVFRAARRRKSKRVFIQEIQGDFACRPRDGWMHRLVEIRILRARFDRLITLRWTIFMPTADEKLEHCAKKSLTLFLYTFTFREMKGGDTMAAKKAAVKKATKKTTKKTTKKASK